MPLDYTYGKIYKIVSDKTNKVYIGSTCKNLSERLRAHQSCWCNYKKGNYCRVTVFELFELGGKCKIELVCDFPCNNADELRMKEYEIMQLPEYKDIIVNKNRPFNNRTRDERLTAQKNYYSSTKAIRRTEITHCCCGYTYSYYTKSRHLRSIQHINYLKDIPTTTNDTLDTTNIPTTTNDTLDTPNIQNDTFDSNNNN